MTQDSKSRLVYKLLQNDQKTSLGNKLLFFNISNLIISFDKQITSSFLKNFKMKKK